MKLKIGAKDFVVFGIYVKPDTRLYNYNRGSL